MPAGIMDERVIDFQNIFAHDCSYYIFTWYYITKILNPTGLLMALLKVICWALIFIIRIRFPPGKSLVTILNLCFGH